MSLTKEHNKVVENPDETVIKYKFPYWGPFVMDVEMEDKIISLLLEKGKESREKKLDHRKSLAGMIDNEYYYEDPDEWFCPLFNPYVYAYIEAVSNYKKDAFKWTPRGWGLEKLWINYQKAYEYNPPHSHGGDLSFVIYLQIPEEILKENKETKHIHNNAGPGTISFDIGPDLPFYIAAHDMLPTVGQTFIFPAWLSHHVLAFKSDVERISVSGNIVFKK